MDTILTQQNISWQTVIVSLYKTILVLYLVKREQEFVQRSREINDQWLFPLTEQEPLSILVNVSNRYKTVYDSWLDERGIIVVES